MKTNQQKISTFFIVSFFALGCSFSPQATITVNSLSPSEGSTIDKTSALSIDMSYAISNLKILTNTRVEVYLNDSNKNVGYGIKTIPVTETRQNLIINLSGNDFYNCYTLWTIETCSRKTALPYRLYITVDDDEYGRLGITREYTYQGIP